jgi:proline dehydrogenase
MNKAIALALPAVPKPIVGFFSKRYIAGSSRDDAFRVVRELEHEGAMATLDILGEFITSLDEAEASTRAYVDLIRHVAAEKLAATNVSVKLTALGLLLDNARCLENMRALLRAASETNGFVRIDMEDAQCTDRTLAIYRSLRAEFPGRVGVVLQARLRRTLDDIDAVTDEPANFRLCKGIYLEPRTIAYTDAEIIRDNFALALERMFERKAYVGIATHDERVVWEALRLIRRFGLTPSQYEFQMLLGVEEELRRILLKAGHRLRVYVPYGEEWYAYSVRRLRESPQIAGYALRALLRRRPARTP